MRTLFWFTLHQTLFGWRVALSVLFLASPSVLIVVVRSVTKEPELADHYEMLTGSVFLGTVSLLVPLVCLLQSGSVMTTEVESRTIIHLTTRRLRRVTVLLVRFAAIALAVMILADAAVLLHYWSSMSGANLEDLAADVRLQRIAGHWQPDDHLLLYLWLIPLEVLVFLSVFTLVTTLVSRAHLVSIIYFVLVENILGNLPFSVRTCSISHHIRKEAVAHAAELTRFIVPPPPRELVHQLYGSGESALLTLLVVVGVCLAVSATLVSKRELVAHKLAKD